MHRRHHPLLVLVLSLAWLGAAACGDNETSNAGNASGDPDIGSIDGGGNEDLGTMDMSGGDAGSDDDDMGSPDDMGKGDQGTTDPDMGTMDPDMGTMDPDMGMEGCTPQNCTPPGQNATAQCVGDICEYGCEAGWHDINNDLSDPTNSDGCEYECTPSGAEVCDMADNDCDGTTDEDDAQDAPTWYFDDDEDGVGVDTMTQQSCTSPGMKWAMDAGDCDDNDKQVSELLTVYTDMDGDTWTVDNSEQMLCTNGTAPMGFTTTEKPGDCNDGEDTVYPDAPGKCDGLDNDCKNGVDDLQVDTMAADTFTPLASSNASRADLSIAGTPEVMATRITGGFCTVQLDSSTGRVTFSRLDTSTGGIITNSDATLVTTRNHKLLDIDWDGQNCAVLYWSEYKTSSNGRRLSIMRWNPGTIGGPISNTLVSDTELLPPLSTDKRIAAFYPECAGLGGCTDSWIVAYQQRANAASSDYQVRVLGIAQSFGPTTSLSGPYTIDNNIGDDYDDIEVGPSPRASQMAAIVYRKFTTSAQGWQVAVSGGSLQLFLTSNSLELPTNHFDFELPVLTRIAGQAFLVRYNSAAHELEVRTVIYDTSTNAFDYPSTVTLPSLDPRVFASKEIMYPGPGFGIDFWLLDSIGYTSDRIYTVDGAQMINIPTNNIASALTIGNAEQQFLSMRQSNDDTLEVLSVSNGSPIDLRIEKYTCH
jgi:hypothetical protein